MSKQLKADIALFLVTIGWGASFILTKNSLAELPTFNFLAIRFFIAFLVSSAIFIKDMIKIDKKTFKYGIILGIILYAMFGFQTMGLRYTTASKSAFITGFNVVLVPIFSTLMIRKMPNRKTVLSVILAFTGVAMLSLKGSISEVNIGDVYTLISAIIFAAYIILVGKYTLDSQSVPLAVVQIGIVGFLSLLTSFTAENPTIPTSGQVWINIIILSVVCTSGAYIVQSVAQKYTSPTHTALIYTAEPVFAAMFGYIIYREVLSPKATIGAILILAGMLITEVDFKLLLNKKKIEEVEASS
ncbi:DMT family transporter [Wukongibacter baidiensis]|uniref:DMT family transporter n=1 Tax=Wukongibacter baidiensis TaxID=1723361 RepID=UPI003D7F4605